MNNTTRLLGVLSLGFLAFAGNLHAIDELFTSEEVANSFTLPEVDQPPQPVKQEQPDLSRSLATLRGLARVGFLVDEAGDVVAPRIQESSDPRFEEPTLKAIAEWKFKPAMKGGKAVPVRVIVPFRFSGN